MERAVTIVLFKMHLHVYYYVGRTCLHQKIKRTTYFISFWDLSVDQIIFGMLYFPRYKRAQHRQLQHTIIL